MNTRMIAYSVGRIFQIQSLLFLLPLIVSLYYGEVSVWVWVLCSGITFLAGKLMSLREPEKTDLYSKDGLLIVSLVWVSLALTCALPYLLTGTIPSFPNAFFESVSGLSTTGTSVIANVEGLPPSILFWRSFTQFMGGMGILVFALAIMPKVNKRSFQLMRAEVPGPVVGKLVSRIGDTAKILYLIYIALFLCQVVFLVAGGMSFFESLLISMGSAGTGGFAIRNANIAHYGSTYVEMVIAVFTMLFGINFQLYFLLLLRKFRVVFRNEEMRLYFGIIFVATIAIASSTLHLSHDAVISYRDAFFHVTSFITSTGYATVDFNQWTLYARMILMVLMLTGACAGSTAAGIKLVRFVIMGKGARYELKRFIHPNRVVPLQLDGKKLPDTVIRGVGAYLFVYVLVFFTCMLVLASRELNLLQAFTATLSALNNIGIEIIGGQIQYVSLSVLSKMFLCLIMMMGRLEIFPFPILLLPSTWQER